MRNYALWMIATLIASLPRVSGAEEALTADKAVQMALERNPELTSLSAEVQAADARLRGASLFLQSNPALSGSLGPHFSAGGSQLDYEVGLSQELEVFGQRAARIDAARAGKSVVELRWKARRSELAAQVRQAFVHALAAEQLVLVAQESLALARQTVQAAEKKLEVGDGSRIEVNTARIEVGRSTRELNVAMRNQATTHA
ncbi:MAG TPA: TolC family protein, partial [Polyangiaceae bacterium]|nr:TolC family protein [Polyangiaceae bacterium]